jgi:NifB/MoaA-like Fe-S oxidoreductase
VGAVRRFLDDFDLGLSSVPRLPGRRIRIATGASMFPFLHERAPRLAQATGSEVQVVHVHNRMFGETVTVAGLLAGEDIRHALGEARPEDLILIPAESLNADRLFIDSMPLAALADAVAPARVVAGHEVTAALRSA